MAYIDGSMYGVGVYPYRYYSFSPSSGTYQDDQSITISANLHFYDSSWSGRYQSFANAYLEYRNASGAIIATDNISNVLKVNFSGTSGTFTIPLESCPSAKNTSVVSVDVMIQVNVFTQVGPTQTTVVTPLADSNFWIPTFMITHTTACMPPKYVEVSESKVSPGKEVTLSWRESSAGTGNPITRYDVYRSTSASGTYTKLESVYTSATSGTLKVKAPSTNGSSYYYKVYTIGTKSGYDSEISSAYATLTCSYSVPGTPSNVTVNNSTSAYVKGNETVTLAWKAPSAGTNNPITGYIVYQDGVEYKTVTGTSLTVPPREKAGTYYTYTVVAKGTYSNSSASAGVKVYTYSDPIAPNTVLVNGAESVYVNEGAEVALTWYGADSGSYNPITSYQVYRNGVAYRTTTDMAMTVPSASVVGGEDSYAVVALGARSNSPMSKAVKVYTYAPVKPPKVVSVSNPAPDPNTKVTLFWTNAESGQYNAIAGYKIYEDLYADGSYLLIDTIYTTNNSGSYELTAVDQASTSCRYKIGTLGTYGESGMSEAYAEYTTKAYGGCTPPTSVTITKNNSNAGGTATLYWSGALSGNASQIRGYAVYRSTQPDLNYVKQFEVAEEYADVTASENEGETYYYKIQTLAREEKYNSELSSAYAWLRTNVTTDVGGNSVPASSAFHAAIKNGEKQRALIYFYDDGLWLTNDDIVSTGITYENYFCPEEDMTIGLTPCSTISFSLFNENHRLDNMRFGKFRASLGVVTAHGTFEPSGNVTVLYSGDTLTGHSNYPYIRANGVALNEQPVFPVKSIIVKDDLVYCLGDDEQFAVYRKTINANGSGVLQNTWQQVVSMTWDDLRSFRWGAGTKYTREYNAFIGTIMLVAAERYANKMVGVVVESDNVITDYLPNGQIETYTYVDLGIFFADRPARVKTNIVSVEGYDGMSKFDVSTENMSITFPITLYGLLDTVCAFTGVQHKVRSFPNQSITIDETADIFQDVTAREVLGFIAEAAGVNAKIDYDGMLMFAWWSDSGLMIDESDYSTYVPYEYFVKPIDRLQIRGSENDIGILIGEGTNGYIIQENPFLNFTSDIQGQSVATAIYEKLASFGVYTPGGATWFGDWSYRPGDIITVSYIGKSYRFPIFAYTLKWAGSAIITLESTGNEYRDVLDAQSRELYAIGRKMLQISKTIDGVKLIASEAKTTSEGAVEKVTTVEANVEGIRTEVKKIEDGQDDMASTIKQQAGQIALKVSKGEVVTEINASADATKIKSGKIALEGIVTANNKFKVLLDGSIEATDGKFSGDLSSGNWTFDRDGAAYTNGNQGVNMTVMSGDFVGGGSGTRAFFGSTGIDVQYGSDYNRNTYIRSGNIIVVTQNPEEMSQYGTVKFVRSESGQASIVCGESQGQDNPNDKPESGSMGNLGLDTQYWDYTFTRVLRAKTYPGSSSRAIKQHIEELPDMGDVIDKLVPVSFEYKSDPNQPRYGLIYEDTKEVMPVICFDDGKGDPGIIYTDLIAPLLKEIQTLRARVKALEERM